MSSSENIENIPLEGKIISDGLEIAYLDWQATGQVHDNLLVLHPNGFCAGMFDPIARLISENYRVVGVDLRGHGASEEVLVEAALGNDLMASDVLKAKRQLASAQKTVITDEKSFKSAVFTFEKLFKIDAVQMLVF